MSTHHAESGQFGKWLSEYIKNHQTSALELANAADLSVSTLLRIIREKNRKPSYDTIIKLSLATGESQDTLLELAELPALSGKATMNPLRPKLLEIFNAMSPSMQRSYISVGESMLKQTRKANP